MVEWLEEIICIYEDFGCLIFNLYCYMFEEGGMKQMDIVQFVFKKEIDLKGLFNFGKMIVWDNLDFDFKFGKNYFFLGFVVLMEVL